MASRKEYEALAAVISDLQHYGQEGSREIVAIKMADWFAADNKAFDQQRFLDACDLTADRSWANSQVIELDKLIRWHKEDTSVKN